MHRLAVAAVIAVATFATGAFAAEPTAFTSFVAFEKPEGATIELHHAGAAEFGELTPEIDARRGVVSFLLPNAVSKIGQAQFDAGGAVLSRARLSGWRDNRLKVRFYTQRDYAPASDRVKVETGKGVLRIHLLREAPPAPVAASAEPPREEKLDRAFEDPIDLSKVFADAAAPIASAAPAVTESPAAAPEASIEADAALAANGGANDAFDLSGGVTKMISALFVALAAILLLAGLWKRLGRGSMMPGAKGAAMRVISTIPVGLKKQISLVEVAGEVLVVGVGEGEISMLTRITDPEALARIGHKPPASVSAAAAAAAPGQNAKAAGAPDSFANELARHIAQYSDKAEPAPEPKSPAAPLEPAGTKAVLGSIFDNAPRHAGNGHEDGAVHGAATPPKTNGHDKTHAPVAAAATLDAIRERLATMRRI